MKRPYGNVLREKLVKSSPDWYRGPVTKKIPTTRAHAPSAATILITVVAAMLLGYLAQPFL